MKTLIRYDSNHYEFDTEQSDLILEVGAGFFSNHTHMQLYKTKNKEVYVLFYPASKETDILSIPKATEFYYKYTQDLDKIGEVFGKEVPVI